MAAQTAKRTNRLFNNTFMYRSFVAKSNTGKALTGQQSAFPEG
jgi:hypothetical protein